MRSNKIRSRYKAKKRYLAQVNKLALKHFVSPTSAFFDDLFKRNPMPKSGGTIIEETIHYKEDWNGYTDETHPRS